MNMQLELLQLNLEQDANEIDAEAQKLQQELQSVNQSLSVLVSKNRELQVVTEDKSQITDE